MKLLLTLLLMLTLDASGQLAFFRQPETVASGGGGGGTNFWSTNGLSVYYRLDEASGTRVDAANGVDLTANNTPSNAPLQITNGVLLASASSQYLSVANNTLLDPGNSGTTFTINFWITNNTTSAFQYLASKGNYPTTLSYAVAIGNGGSLPSQRFGLIIGATLDTVRSINPIQGDLAKRMLTAVYDGTKTGNTNRVKIYVNGVDDTTSDGGTIPSSISTSSEVFSIGQIFVSSTPSLFCNGALDEYAFFTNAMSAANVLLLYKSYTNGFSYPTNP